MRDSESTFAGYRLHRVIAHDAVSSTYRAVRQTDRGDRAVALQISQPFAGLDRAATEAARRKAEAVADVEHPGVARVLETGTVDGRLYVATTWRESVTLGQLLDRRWRLPAADARALLEPLATGLDTIHAAGVVHGSLSTHSIRVTTSDTAGGNRAFLTGFGIGDLLALRMGSRRQREQEPALDDLLYVAPEQLRGDPLSAATDQYALACALYHCVTGQPPFVRDTASALFGAHLFAHPVFADVPPDDESPTLRERLIVGLAKQPQDRHQSCVDLTGAALAGTISLSAALRSSERDRRTVEARTSRVLSSVSQRLPVPLLPLAALVLVVSLAALAFVVLRDSGDTTAAALADAPQAASAVGQSDAGSDTGLGSGAEQEPAAQREAAAAVDWDVAVATTQISSVTPAGDLLVVVADDGVAAVDPADGTPRWQQPVADGEVSDAVVADDVVVYRSSALHALGLADGEARWTRDDELAPTRSLTASSDGVIYGAGPGQGLFEVDALDAATGDEQWHFHGDNGRYVDDSARVAADEDLVVVAEPGLLRALDPSGDRVTTSLGRIESAGSAWQLDGVSAWLPTVTLTDDAVVLATRDGEICSYARDDGLQRWCEPVAGVADNRPTVLADDGRVTVATRSAVAVLDAATGEALWEVTADSRVTAADASEDTVIVGEAAGMVRAYDAESGDLRWALPDQGRIDALALTDDAAYAGRRDGTVARLRPPPPG